MLCGNAPLKKQVFCIFFRSAKRNLLKKQDSPASFFVPLCETKSLSPAAAGALPEGEPWGVLFFRKCSLSLSLRERWQPKAVGEGQSSTTWNSKKKQVSCFFHFIFGEALAKLRVLESHASVWLFLIMFTLRLRASEESSELCGARGLRGRRPRTSGRSKIFLLLL